jgi:acylpyruvate hydrolase
VIGEGGRHIPPERPWEHVGGLTVLNDVTARDFQRRATQWFAGKSFQASTPMGPWIVTPDELGDLSQREIVLTVNGAERLRAPLGDLVFDVPALIADISRIVELEPGDVLAMGTPGGVGEPQGMFVRDGDVIAVSIDGIGSIRNTVPRGSLYRRFEGAGRPSGRRPPDQHRHRRIAREHRKLRLAGRAQQPDTRVRRWAL